MSGVEIATSIVTPAPITNGHCKANMNDNGADQVLASALSSARIEEQFRFEEFHFVAVRDHILPSQCRHSKDSADTISGEECQVCEYERELADLPQLPEMIFPNNTLTVNWRNNRNKSICFNALDALRLVDAKRAPDVKVGASKVWSQSRCGMDELTNVIKPFDWTFTTDYDGSVRGLKVEETTDRIDMEKLKRREPIHFYTQLTLFEDELADHGCAQLTVRLRVMPSTFFLLQRFYLRIDNVLVRIIDTRLFGETNTPYLLRESTRREINVADMAPADHEHILDPNALWSHLPVIEHRCTKLICVDDDS